MLRVSLALIVLSVTIASAQPAARSTGERHLAAAQTHYRAGRYAEAIEELRLAHVADPQPQYVWAIAQALRVSGDCARAIESYGEYLRTGPKPEATKITQGFVDDCEATLAARAATPTPAVTAAPPPLPSEPLVIREVQRVYTHEVYVPWYRDWKGNALVGSGLAGLLIGATALVIAQGHDDDATSARSYNELDQALHARDRAELIGGIALTTGGALVVAGLVRYAIRPKRIRTEVTVEPIVGGATIGVTWTSW